MDYESGMPLFEFLLKSDSFQLILVDCWRRYLYLKPIKCVFLFLLLYYREHQTRSWFYFPHSKTSRATSVVKNINIDTWIFEAVSIHIFCSIHRPVAAAMSNSLLSSRASWHTHTHCCAAHIALHPPTPLTAVRSKLTEVLLCLTHTKQAL